MTLYGRRTLEIGKEMLFFYQRVPSVEPDSSSFLHPSLCVFSFNVYFRGPSDHSKEREKEKGERREEGRKLLSEPWNNRNPRKNKHYFRLHIFPLFLKEHWCLFYSKYKYSVLELKTQACSLDSFTN